jgi:thiol-disulfide isomerase/thioredoxin
MKRQYKNVYVFAAVLSIVLYALGILTGIYLQKNTERVVERRLDEIEKSIESTQLEYLYITSLGDKISCDALRTMVDDTTNNVWQIGQQLIELEGSKNDRFFELKKQYSLLSIRAWIFNNYLNDKCKDDKIILLYFYSIPCPDCEKQGKELDELRGDFKDDIKIFVLDGGLDLPMINTLKKTYGINVTPSVVFGNKTFSGFISKEELVKALSD